VVFKNLAVSGPAAAYKKLSGRFSVVLTCKSEVFITQNGLLINDKKEVYRHDLEAVK
jgi:hypothetical protein